MKFTKHPDLKLAVIPETHIDTVMSGLAAIINQIYIPSVDSIFNKYCIHVLYGYRATRMQVKVSDTSWTKNWENLQTTTGYAALDSFMERYHLKVTDFYHGTGANRRTAYLLSDSVYNTEVLIDSIKKFKGVEYAYEPGVAIPMFYPQNMWYERDSVTRISFEIGWMDMDYIRWQYKVTDDCRVELVNIVNSARNPQPPENCNRYPHLSIIQSGPKKNIKVYPNPATDYIHIDLSMMKYTRCMITDMYGRVMSNRNVKDNEQVDVRALPAVIYTVTLMNGSERYVQKLVKH
jgi:hypothetical protein